MAKQYVYTDTKSGKVIFESVEPNYVSIEDVDKKVVSHTGHDPRLNPFISRQIKVVSDSWPPHRSNNRNGLGKPKRR